VFVRAIKHEYIACILNYGGGVDMRQFSGMNSFISAACLVDVSIACCYAAITGGINVCNSRRGHSRA
jgi:hypothetical protein